MCQLKVDSSRSKCVIYVLLRIIDFQNLPSKWLFNEEILFTTQVLELETLKKRQSFIKVRVQFQIKYDVLVKSTQKQSTELFIFLTKFQWKRDERQLHIFISYKSSKRRFKSLTQFYAGKSFLNYKSQFYISIEIVYTVNLSCFLNTSTKM